MTVAWEAKNKMDFTDSRIQEPVVGDPLRSAWEINNKIVLAWAVRALSKEIAESVMFHNKVEGLWRELRQRFSQGHQSHIVDLQEELYSSKQGSNSVTRFSLLSKRVF